MIISSSSQEIISKGDLLVSQLVLSYPLSQVQLYLLTASVQVPPFRHGLLPHSFVSRHTNSYLHIYIYIYIYIYI